MVDIRDVNGFSVPVRFNCARKGLVTCCHRSSYQTQIAMVRSGRARWTERPKVEISLAQTDTIAPEDHRVATLDSARTAQEEHAD